MCNRTRIRCRVVVWHYRLFHLNYEALHKMSTIGKAVGVPPLPLLSKLCSTYMQCRQHREKAPKKSFTRFDKKNGGHPHRSLRIASNAFFLRFKIFSNIHRWFFKKNLDVFLSSLKSLRKVQTLQQMIENAEGCKIQGLRSDNGGEFKSFWYVF